MIPQQDRFFHLQIRLAIRVLITRPLELHAADNGDGDTSFGRKRLDRLTPALKCFQIPFEEIFPFGSCCGKRLISFFLAPAAGDDVVKVLGFGGVGDDGV
jgi:hypothetical protein